MNDEYYQFPKWLLETELNNTERIVYMLILDRARLSQRSGFHKNGNCYGIITAREITETAGIKRSQVRQIIQNLVTQGLIVTQQGKGICSWYFPKKPDGSYAVPVRNIGREGSGKSDGPVRKIGHNGGSEKSDTSNNKITNKNGESALAVTLSGSEEEMVPVSPEEFRRIMESVRSGKK